MKIKNKYSKKRIDKNYLLLNKIINIKKYIRNKTAKIKPLTDMEKFLYTDSKIPFQNQNTIMPSNKYIIMNDIFLLNIVSKKDCNNLYVGLINLYKDNYLEGYLGGQIRTADLKKCIDNFKNSKNDKRWTRLCDITPKDKEMNELCDFITISIFEMSNDLIGIAFDLKVTNKFNDTIYNLFNQKVEIKTIYDKYRYKNKYVYGKATTSIQEKRNNDFEDFILEFKSRFNKLFSKYLPLQLDYKNRAPISINLYQTNFYVTDRKELFYQTLNILESYSAQKRENLDVCIREENKSDNIIKTVMWYNIGMEYKKIDRSNNILFYIEDIKYRIIHGSSEFVNFFIATITFYLLDEMQEDITKEKNKLYNCKNYRIKKNLNQFKALNVKFYRYSSIFNGLDIHKVSYKDKYISNGFNHIKKIYKDYDNQLSKLKKEYDFRININNVKSTYYLALLSMLIALIALVISIFFEYRNENKTSINDIKTQIDVNNDKLDETNSLINEIKELIKEKH